MPTNTSRRNWLKHTSLAALGIGFSFRSMGNEDGLVKYFNAGDTVINLGANENPYGISPNARQAIMEMLAESNRYQFNVAGLRSFTKTLADHYNVNEDQVLVTAGSGDGLALLARHFTKGNIISADITFSILPNTAKRIGTKVIEVPLTDAKVHDLTAMLKAINNETELVYICNPANPTATIVDPGSLKNFCQEASKKTVVLIDEAYNEFMDNNKDQSMISMTTTNPNILVIKTFSKIHAMAGLRVGFIIGHPSLITRLKSNYFQNTQFAVSNLTMAAALASLNDEAHQSTSKLKNDAAKKYTMDEMKKLGLSPFPSHTNFIFYSVKNYKGNYAADMYDKYSIILRANNYPDGQWARVSIGTMEEMRQFISTLKSIAG